MYVRAVAVAVAVAVEVAVAELSLLDLKDLQDLKDLKDHKALPYKNFRGVFCKLPRNPYFPFRN